MSFKSTIRISKLQSKNRMVGQAFNPGGWTSESLDKRDSDFLELFNNKSSEEKQKTKNSLKILAKLCDEKGWSFPFEYNLLERKGFLKNYL